VEGPADVDVVLSDGRRGTISIAGGQVRREGNFVRHVALFTPAGPMDPACATAHLLLGHWQIPGRESLEKWQEKRHRNMPAYQDPDGTDWFSPAVRPPTYPQCGLAVRTTHRSDIPWCVEWAVGLAPPGAAPPVTPQGSRP
jgi:hypothetical protein